MQQTKNNQTIDIMMKKTILLTSIIAIAIVRMLSSCVDSEKDLYDPSYQTANPMGDGFAAPDGFDWNMTTTSILSIEIDDELYNQIEILDANMRPVKLNDLHAGMQWIPLVPEQNNILPYSARLKSTQKSVNPGLVRASATFTLEFQ